MSLSRYFLFREVKVDFIIIIIKLRIGHLENVTPLCSGSRRQLPAVRIENSVEAQRILEQLASHRHWSCSSPCQGTGNLTAKLWRWVNGTLQQEENAFLLHISSQDLHCLHQKFSWKIDLLWRQRSNCQSSWCIADPPLAFCMQLHLYCGQSEQHDLTWRPRLFMLFAWFSHTFALLSDSHSVSYYNWWVSWR